MVIPVSRSPRGSRPTIEGPGFLARADLQVLFDLLREDGRQLIGPTVADGAIVYDEITSVDQLPRGWGDEQSPGRYRLRRRGDERLFGYVVGPTAWKKWTFPALIPLTRSTHDGHKVSFEPEQATPPKLAFLGARACELAALGVQDRVLIGTEFIDPDYMVRRANVFVVAVQCTTSASTCFCTSMGTGPEVTDGFDLSLTELDAGFLVDSGTPAGRAVLERLPPRATRGRPAHHRPPRSPRRSEGHRWSGCPLTRGAHSQFVDPDRARLELRCARFGVRRIDSEHVRGHLVWEMKREEREPRSQRFVKPDWHLDRPAARAHPHGLTILDTESLPVQRRDQQRLLSAQG